MRKIIFPLCLWAISAAIPVMGQTASVIVSADELYQQGKEMFEGKNWDGCLDQLARFKDQTGKCGLVQQADKAIWTLKNNKNPFLCDPDWWQEADYMMAVSAFEKGKSYALDLLKGFLDTYPASRYRPEVIFRIGSYYFLQTDYPQSADWLEQTEVDKLPLNLQPAYLQRLGVSYLKNSRTSDARPLFEVLSQTENPYQHSANYYLAYLDYADGNYSKAKARFLSLPDEPEYRQSVPYYLTQIYYIEGDRTKALDSALSLLRQPVPQEQEAELNRIAASCQYENGFSSKALPYFRRYFQLSDAPLRSASLMGGVCASGQGDYPTAVSWLSQVTGQDDKYQQRAYLYLGLAYLNQGDMRNARMAFERASKSTYDTAVQEQAWYNYGMVVHESTISPFNESVVVFESFLNNFPNSVYTERVNDCLADVYTTTRNYQAALNSISKIRNPGTKILTAKQRVLFQLGTEQVANADLDKAQQYFTQAIQLGNLNQETRAQAFFWRGECAYRNALYPQAESDFSQFLALTRQPEKEIFALGRYNLAYTYFKQNQFAKSLDWFGKYVSIPSEQNKNTYTDALNRMGDAHFYLRQFAQAESYYSKAANSGEGLGDYALFQKGFMAGLQKDYPAKIQAMKQLLNTWPNSEYADDALFEQGKTYVTMGRQKEALDAFSQLCEKFPNSSQARKAGIEQGLLYFNSNHLDKAVDAYKNVVSKYPGSEEAKIAVEDLKSVYIEMNDIPSYAAYIGTLKGKVAFAAEEQDSLTYQATEKVLARGNAAQSKKALTNYLQSFEQGAFRLHAQTELGRIYYSEKDYPQALRYYEAVLQQHANKYTEEALARCAEIYYLDGDMTQALQLFRELSACAEQKENKEAARLGILRASKALGKTQDVVAAANDLLAQTALSPELRMEAQYDRAKALLELKKSVEAEKDLTALAKDTPNGYP